MLIALAPNDLACDVASPIAQQEYNARDDIRLPTSNPSRGTELQWRHLLHLLLGAGRGLPW